MKIKGKNLKEFFTSAKGVFIEKETMYVFIDCEHGKSNVIIKPSNEINRDMNTKVLFSQVFDAVKLLDDEKEYEVDLVFNVLQFITKTKEGKYITELIISGQRY